MMAMILAAGRGERMRPLTDTTPKPLLKVQNKPLIVYQVEALAVAGVKQIVINTGRLGEQIQDYLGSGETYGVSIQYSHEGDEPLETAGGIYKALPLLESEYFIVTNADIFTDFDYRALPRQIETDAHLVLVGNPTHNSKGDFALEEEYVLNEGADKFTYSGIGLYSHAFFKGCVAGKAPLAPMLRQSAEARRLSGQYFAGLWNDIGTPERLAEANK